MSEPNYDRFTERARNIVVQAKNAATVWEQTQINEDALLYALVDESESIAAEALDNLGVTLDRVASRRLPGNGHNPPTELTPRVKKVFENALREALSLGHNYIGTEHILLALVGANGPGMNILEHCGLDEDRVRNEVLRLLSGPIAVKKPVKKHEDKQLAFDLAIRALSVAQAALGEAVAGLKDAGDENFVEPVDDLQISTLGTYYAIHCEKLRQEIDHRAAQREAA